MQTATVRKPKTRKPKTAPVYPIMIERFGYTVTLHTASRATVSGGRLAEPVGVRKLLGEGDANPKTEKNEVPTMGLSLYPADGIGFGNVCPFAKVCVRPCLAHQGQGPVPSVAGARVAKTVLWYLAREWFLSKLHRELANFRDAHPEGDTVGVRLNMFSDIPWEEYGVFDVHPGITFYDYTKNPNRWGQVRPNYWVTFSYDGTNGEAADNILRQGGNVSAVFWTHEADLLRRFESRAACGKAAHRQLLPASFRGFPVIDGGKTDWRPEDPRGVFVGLRLLARTYESRQSAIDSGFAALVDTSRPILGE